MEIFNGDDIMMGLGFIALDYGSWTFWDILCGVSVGESTDSVTYDHHNVGAPNHSQVDETQC